MVFTMTVDVTTGFGSVVLVLVPVQCEYRIMLTTYRRVRCRTTCTLESTCALGFSPQLLKLDLEDAGLASTLSYGPVGFGCGLRTGGGAMPITMAQLASGERVTRGRLRSCS